MKEGQITVIKAGESLYYTAWVRRVYFLFRGPWTSISPNYQPAYNLAMEQLIDNL